VLKISEFSRLGRVPASTLRYYDEAGLLRPALVDAASEYRYYRIEQLEQLHRILALKDMGFALADIATIVARDPSPDELGDLFAGQLARLATEAEEARQRLQRARVRLDRLAPRTTGPRAEIVVKAADALQIATVRRTGLAMHAIGAVCEASYDALYRDLRRARVRPAPVLPPEVTLYHNDDYTETDIDMEVAVVVGNTAAEAKRLRDAGIDVRPLPAEPRVAAVVHQGGFHDLDETVADLFHWLAASGLRSTGPLRELHLFGRVGQAELDHPRDDRFVLELQVPFAETESATTA
jgi:DNA-binding transcriptional MerR regulator/effector-binding domain-containing protein